MPQVEPLSPIVSATWLQSQVGPEALVVCDVRSTMGGADPDAGFAGGHLPDAVLVVLDDVLATAPDDVHGRHPLPSPTEFAAALGGLGIGDDTTVVAYDDRGGAFAGRLVWMLRIIGRRAALLDGGLANWSGELETGPPAVRATATSTSIDWPGHALADANDVVAHIAAGGVVIDSRDAARYAGEIEPIDAVAGHIPGAINLAFTANLTSDGRFRSPGELATRFAAVAGDDAPIVYCGSGVTACHNALAIELAGLALARVYVGSWSAWSADADRPVATGATP